MEGEIRIYFESIEQANHFILPAIVKALKKIKLEIPIKLVKLKGNYKYYGRKIAPIIYWKDPDILISLVNGKEEIPLIVLEFSNAVFTEDHELQRFDGLVAAAENNCIYIKISPINKESPSQHGGNIEFDYVKPYALIFKKYGKIFFHFDWPVDKNSVVITNKDYLSCPNEIEEFNTLLMYVFEVIKENSSNDWIEKTYEVILRDDNFREWFKTLKDYNLNEEIELNTSRTRWILEDKKLGKRFLELKLNRFGHAMDPERGMLAFYGTLIDNVISKMLFVPTNDAWYKDIPTENKIRSHIKKYGLKTGFDFLYCFMLGSGLFRNEDFKNIVKNFEKDSSKSLDIDLTQFIRNNFSKLNKALRTIFRFSKQFYIEDSQGKKRVIFSWSKTEINESFDSLSKTQLRRLTELDEDLVTYITIHNILRPNKFKILAASYPGAQADRVVLIEPQTGRRQKRKYIDIISFLPTKNITALQEDKGKFSPAAIQKDIDELSKYKTDNSYKEAIKNFQRRFEPKSVDSTIKIGVGFWSNPNFTISRIKDLDLKELDYFIYITPDMKTWKVWRTGNKNMFSKTEGKVEIPSIYEVIENKTRNIKELSNFIR